MEDKPNINRIVNALKYGGLKHVYTQKTFGMNLSDAFQQFVIEEEFDDYSMEDEFGDGRREESFFMDWLHEEKAINKSKLNDVWNDLNKAFKGEYDASDTNDKNVYDMFFMIYYYELLVSGYIKKNVSVSIPTEIIKLIQRYHNLIKMLMLHVTDKHLQRIEQQIYLQCVRKEIGRQLKSHRTFYATPTACKLLQIGKQNGYIPLTIYLFDAYNRYRIQRRKDIGINEFIFERCKGINQWLAEYPKSEVDEFKNICSQTINFYHRRFLSKAPMSKCVRCIDDSIIQIGFYIFETYSFIQQYISQNTASLLPSHIDIVIIPKSISFINYISDESDSDGMDELNDERARDPLNIEKRLKDEENVIKHAVKYTNAQHLMLKSVNTIISNKPYQRAIIIIDRNDENDKEKDILYAYQPNVKTKCNSFESDPDKFLSEALFSNSKNYLLPKVDYNDEFSLSFHCFSSNEVRVYLWFNGFCTRFFIQDLKYYLPAFFVKEQREILQDVFGKHTNRNFQNEYKLCKRKCIDRTFENFYKGLICDGSSAH